MDQPGEPESMLDCVKLWSEMIDQGGLYHINKEVVDVQQCMHACVSVHVY